MQASKQAGERASERASTRHHGALHCGAVPGVAQGQSQSQSGLRRDRSLLQPARLPVGRAQWETPLAAGDSPAAGGTLERRARRAQIELSQPSLHDRPPGRILTRLSAFAY